MKLILFLVRRVLSLRYRVKLHWVENLKHDWPILILPNHIALVDPRIMISYLWKYIIASPVASEKYYKLPVLKQVMQMKYIDKILRVLSENKPLIISQIICLKILK